MIFRTAIARTPASSFAQGITGATWVQPPDYTLICRQHQAYVDTLRHLGLDVRVLDPEPEFPDSYFVEDTAVILGDTAVITRPGAAARRGEAEKIIPAVKPFKHVTGIEPPGLLDGGDVMVAERHVFIGLSQRTNAEGARQLGQTAHRVGFTWSTLPVLKSLHLKSGINYLGQNAFLMDDAYSQRPEFVGGNRIVVAPDELPAANTLAVNGTLLTPKGFPDTRKKLETLGMPVLEMDISEVMKMDGGLSCMSLRF
jgi:dimethylargininase